MVQPLLRPPRTSAMSPQPPGLPNHLPLDLQVSGGHPSFPPLGSLPTLPSTPDISHHNLRLQPAELLILWSPHSAFFSAPGHLPLLPQWLVMGPDRAASNAYPSLGGLVMPSTGPQPLDLSQQRSCLTSYMLFLG